MKLDAKERLLFANQYRILARLDKENAETYGHWQKALEHGFASAYSQIFDQIYDGLTEDECGFVTDVLSMYEALQRSYDQYGAASGLKQADVAFPGFDGNNETLFMLYARFVRQDEGRFDYLKVSAKDLNSHFPSVGLQADVGVLAKPW
jgi:uncharacterized protein YfbU (UPF0304 family)